MATQPVPTTPAAALAAGRFAGGLPYLRMNGGPRPLVMLAGFSVDNRLPSGLSARLFRMLFTRYLREHTVYYVQRRAGMPAGYTLADMAREYATAIERELGPCPVLGLSTGGLIAQHLALDRPDLVTALVLGISGCRISDEGRATLGRIREAAARGDWTAVYLELGPLKQSGRVGQWLYRVVVRLFGRRLVPPPDDPADLLVLIDADLLHDATARLPSLRVPTLVIGGAIDPAFPETLLRETAALIPGAALKVFPGVGHDAVDKRKRAFEEAVLAFLAKNARA